MDVVERRLRDLLTDDRLDLVARPDAVAAVHRGVRRRRLRARVSTAAGAVVMTAAVVAAVALVPSALEQHRQHTPSTLARPPAARDWSLGTVQPLPAGVAGTTAFTASGGVAWVGAPGHLVRMDTGTGRTTSYTVDGDPQSIAATPRHVWVGLVTPTGCRLEERDPAGPRRHVFAVPCGPAAQLSVTANGAHAWVLTGTATGVTLRLYDAAMPTVVAAATVPGTATGSRPLAIGGSSVFVLTTDSGATQVASLGAETLTGLTVFPVPAGTQRLAYGSARLVLAGSTGLFTPARGPGGMTRLGDESATDVTTGNDLVWTVVEGSGSSDLVARDARSGRQVGDVVVDGRVTALVADGRSVWALEQQGARSAVVGISPG